MKKDLLTHVAKTNENTRVLLIGCSNQCYHKNLERTEFKALFQSDNLSMLCYTPCPDYSARVQMWKHFIELKGISIDELNNGSKFDLSVLALATEGYSAGSVSYFVKGTKLIRESIDVCLTPRRIHKYQVLNEHFQNKEFLEAVSQMNYSYQEEFIAFQDFTSEVTGRSKWITDYNAALARQNEQNDKKGDPNKTKNKKNRAFTKKFVTSTV
ncbi:hypothetical protein RFI_35778 [Reticulomyxa filosa]|uniref:Uncharacterized protein n=1 Tax=Reticulomyxa filosa TaxID=46433 RepID=X6LJV3_RETFI|nr:hypothetical protein RFI_35778 [Reticulomyxa filosa]|eukprot:ETO01661.1 hypothetical protein RFI_35778 [Reticulomyxa filosa]